MPSPADVSSLNPLWYALAGSLVALAIACGLYLRSSQAGEKLRSRLDKAQQRLTEISSRDPLTGLIARPEFEQHVEQAALAHGKGGGAFAVVYIGLDNFRALNEAYGHRAGDLLLTQAAKRLQKVFQEEQAPTSRVTGNEFALLVRTGGAYAGEAAQAVLEALQLPYSIDGRSLQLSSSIGIARFPDDGAHTRLLAHASLAMRTVKLGGGGGYALFDPAMAVDVREQAELLQDLRQAIPRGELQLYYQPKVDARSLQVTAAEALLRWQHPVRGMVSPEVFIPLAERHGLIAEIGQWVLEEACRQAASWRKRGLRMRVAVNISGHQLRQDRLVAQIEQLLRRHQIQPGRLTCEITETVAMEDTAHTRQAFEDLRRAGLHVSIDDFGTGHSSLAQLRRLPAAEIKIDRAFVVDLDTSTKARSIVQAVVQMARSLNLRVVAEGVETEAQRDALLALGVDELQGYLFAKPMSAQSLALWADNDRQRSEDGLFRASLFDVTQPDEL